MPLTQYLKAIQKNLAAGNATEHTHRTALKQLVEAHGPGVTATNEPKRIQCGAPDFVVTRGQTPLGYIEAKDVDTPLSREERSGQLKRYREGLNNLILTDYLEFRWYVGGERRVTARVASVSSKGKLIIEDDGAARVEQLLDSFLKTEVKTVKNAKELATRMAAISKLIRETIARALKEEDSSEGTPNPLHDQLKGFRDVLIHDLTESQFADMYAQTISYGLFAARCNAPDEPRFTRQQAAYELPRTNPFLRRLFNQIAGVELDERITWAVDDLAELLNRTDINEILADFGKQTRREDPVFHFYETFLSVYDPALREARGVYYTPEPVVSYIVRSVDEIIRNDFGLRSGLADSSKINVLTADGSEQETHKVLVLDPATGTGTFLYGVIKRIYESFGADLGMWSGYVSDHLLPRIFGFELLMAPYSVAHMKLGLQLAEMGYKFNSDERLRVYLTNAMEEAHKLESIIPFAQWLAEEANAAGGIKKDAPVMVILGNPPYSGQSFNPSEKHVLINKGASYIQKWEVGRNGRPQPLLKKAKQSLKRKQPTFIGRLLWDYFISDGERLKERNPKWLHDDYVKFMRFAQWRIEQTGYGVLAFISNHGYLDNPTFRGMRQSLMQTFDDIYVLDLHGSSKKKERALDGSKDENVFDIQQGVAIGIFVKRLGASTNLATVRHAHLRGEREQYCATPEGESELCGGKYDWLTRNHVATTEWAMLEPRKPFYLFVPQETDVEAEYESGWKITDIMPTHSAGIVTARDPLTIHWTPKEVWETVSDFANLLPEEARAKYDLGKDARDWQVTLAQKDLKKSRLTKDKIKPLLYRPFDVRYTYYTGTTKGFQCMPRHDVMRHMLEAENIGLLWTRPMSPNYEFSVTVSGYIVDQCAIGNKSAGAGISYLGPLYLYPTEAMASLFDAGEPSSAPGGRRPNLNPAFTAAFADRLGMTFIEQGAGDLATTFGPEDVFYYMYGIFHSPTYRSRYAEPLKIDFPHLPLTSKPDLFQSLCSLGAQLASVHLMRTFVPPIVNFPNSGSNVIETVSFEELEEGNDDKGRIYINEKQFFSGVPVEVWEMTVGGYQVCQKWLKDRKGLKLSYDDLGYYKNIVSALSRTVDLMEEIDEAIESNSGFPIR